MFQCLPRYWAEEFAEPLQECTAKRLGERLGIETLTGRSNASDPGKTVRQFGSLAPPSLPFSITPLV
jgi:hypothetical protein